MLNTEANRQIDCLITIPIWFNKIGNTKEGVGDEDENKGFKAEDLLADGVEEVFHKFYCTICFGLDDIIWACQRKQK